jgi:phosphatidylethanolamine/phosphatidyl-N-methylethanolamine N-methyltransferase
MNRRSSSAALEAREHSRRERSLTTSAASRSKPGGKRRASKPLDGLLAFLTQAIRDYQRTGMVWPSSPALAKVMTRSLRHAPGPKRLLEVGPGTGPFTRAILKALRPGDELHVVEVSRVFSKRLEDKMLQPFRERNPNVTVKLYCQPIESASIPGKFDFIVCGLPFNNFPPPLVRSIFRRLLELLNPGGELAYFEYAGVRVMKGPLVGSKGRRQLKQIGMMNKIFRRKHHGRRELVLGNMPPAVAVRLTR